MASVLLVDDSSLVRRTIDKLLSDEGFQVTQAASAELAFEIAGRQPPAAIVSDLRMPGLSGVQLCRLLRAEPATASIPVVLLTASVDRRSRFWAQSAGAQAYVSKTDLRELPGVLRRVLATPVIAPPLPLLEPLSGGAVQRLAQLLDGALFFSVIAGELRSLARYETAEELFRAFAALASGVLSYRWLALAREEQGGVFVHGLPESDALRAEIRAVLPSSGSQRFQFFCEQQGGDGPRGEVLLREIRLGSRLLGRIALAPRHRGIPLEEGAFLDVAARELPLVFHTLGLVEEVRRLRAASSVVAPR